MAWGTKNAGLIFVPNRAFPTIDVFTLLYQQNAKVLCAAKFQSGKDARWSTPDNNDIIIFLGHFTLKTPGLRYTELGGLQILMSLATLLYNPQVWASRDEVLYYLIRE